jgi:hypothetical protein
VKLPRTLRQTIGRLLIGVLLLTQIAVASHACPGMSAMASVGEPAISERLAGPDGAATQGETISRDGPNLCAAHCRQGEQSADTAQALAVQAAIPMFLYALPFEAVHRVGTGWALLARLADQAAAAAPPHAILHCVFRT